MKEDVFFGFCPFEIGDIVRLKDDEFGVISRVHDIITMRSVRHKETAFLFRLELDGVLSTNLEPFENYIRIINDKK